MKIEVSRTKKIYINDLIKGQYPITVYIEDIAPGKGSILIRSGSVAYSASWGTMNSDMSTFFRSCENAYLLKNLMANIFEIDIEGSIKQFKKYLIGLRREGSISKDDLRSFWEAEISINEGFDCITQENQLYVWINNLPCIGDINVESYWFDHGIERKLTYDARQLKDHIIPTIKKALSILENKEDIEKVCLVDKYEGENDGKEEKTD